MRRLRHGIAATAVTVLALTLSACGSQDDQGGGDAAATTVTTAVKVAVESDFDPGRFSDPVTVDNQWFPLKPGTQLTWEGSALDGKDKIARKVVFVVTDLTKTINGLRTVVGFDRDYNDGELVEPELAFFAQDDDGNVWTLGQYPEEYEDGKLVATPAWLAGFEGKAGLVMRTAPATGTADYSQGLGPKVEYADRAKVRKVDERTCVPAGCYEDVLVTEEWDTADPKARQLKYYASGVGNVRVGWAGRDEEKETGADQGRAARPDGPGRGAQGRAEAGAAHKLSKDLYGRTPPASIIRSRCACWSWRTSRRWRPRPARLARPTVLQPGRWARTPPPARCCAATLPWALGQGVRAARRSCAGLGQRCRAGDRPPFGRPSIEPIRGAGYRSAATVAGERHGAAG